MTDRPLVAETIVEHEAWGDPSSLVEAAIATVTAHDPEEFSGGNVVVLFTDDETVHRLNKAFRGKDAPTNVLSFPSGDDFDDPDVALAHAGPVHIGDIALAWETCYREAEEKGIALKDHATHLILHGVLHLFGYDHVEDSDAMIMERLETELLTGMGIADPHAE